MNFYKKKKYCLLKKENYIRQIEAVFQKQPDHEIVANGIKSRNEIEKKTGLATL
jgi:hypothetical protein